MTSPEREQSASLVGCPILPRYSPISCSRDSTSVRASNRPMPANGAPAFAAILPSSVSTYRYVSRQSCATFSKLRPTQEEAEVEEEEEGRG